MSWIYLDNNATTRPDPRVIDAMLPFMREQYANPSSVHHFGQQARHAVETARQQVAEVLKAQPRDIVFTGGGSEANNLAIVGMLAARPDQRHVVTSAVEHDSVMTLMSHLEKQGYRVTRIAVDLNGQLDLDAFARALDEDTAIASIMHANNETGVIFPLETIAEIARSKNVPLHTDATQTVGKIPMNLKELPVALLTFAAHKFHGPKGVGSLYVSRRSRIRPMILGGHQERDLRAGTENVAGIVGTAEALRLAAEHYDDEATRVRDLRDRLEREVVRTVPIADVIGKDSPRLPNTTNIGFAALEAEALLMLMSNEGLCASSGSACSSGSLEPSHVLAAMGIDEQTAHGAVRFSLSRFTTREEIDRAVEIIPRVVGKLYDSRLRTPHTPELRSHT
jgi:cysteine desulfurase